MILKFLVWFIQRSPSTKKWFWKRWYSLFPHIAPNPEFKCMNFGFFSENLHLDLEPLDEVERYPIHLYHHVASQIDLNGKTVLEVGSGRGGGASYIARYMCPVEMIGLDISPSAVNDCNKNYKIDNLSLKASDFYTKQVNASVDRLTSLIEPLLFSNALSSTSFNEFP